MVWQQLKQLLIDRFGCDEEEVTLATSLDELNLYPRDCEEIAFLLGEQTGVDLSTQTIAAWEFVEDIVASFED